MDKQMKTGWVMVYSMASFFTTQYACRGMFTYFLPYVDHATVVASLRW